ncbi:hypothetical protein V6N13_019720 [Hibiscus sabdariffa]
MFTAMEIEDFQILVNRAIATEAKMEVAERRKGGSRSDSKKQKRNDRSQESFKKAKQNYGGSSAYQSTFRSQFTPKPQSVNKSSFLVMSVNSTGNSGEIPLCQYCKKPHRGQCKQQSNLCYGCSGGDHYVCDYPHNANQASTRPPGREDEESPDVIAGIVKLNSHPAYALIDSGSAHSFFTRSNLRAKSPNSLQLRKEFNRSSLDKAKVGHTFSRRRFVKGLTMLSSMLYFYVSISHRMRCSIVITTEFYSICYASDNP